VRQTSPSLVAFALMSACVYIYIYIYLHASLWRGGFVELAASKRQ
jgi:hypothetical protein